MDSIADLEVYILYPGDVMTGEYRISDTESKTWRIVDSNGELASKKMISALDEHLQLEVEGLYSSHIACRLFLRIVAEI